MEKRVECEPRHYVYICDENYVYPTVISVTSLIASKKSEEQYVIHILIKHISERNVRTLESCAVADVEIDCIDVSEYEIPYEAKSEQVHVPVTSLMKFFLPDLFPEVDRMLYIDGDTVILNNLASLFNVDLNSYYAAVCMDWLVMQRQKGHQKKYGIASEEYFNSGLMLLNLQKLRAERIPEKLLDYKMSHETFFMDQDALNAVLGQQVCYVDNRYNFLTVYHSGLSVEDFSRLFPEFVGRSKREFYHDCYVLHLAGHPKPWRYTVPVLSKICKYYFNLSPLPKLGYVFKTKNWFWARVCNKLKRTFLPSRG